MRKKRQIQMPLLIADIDHPKAAELRQISHILDQYPIISRMVWQDLSGSVSNPAKGACGMSAEQVLRAAIIKQIEQFSYEELDFHLMDSRCYRSFCRIGFAEKGFRKSALAAAIKSISAQTWEAINRILVAHAEDTKVEKGRESRVDCTVVCSDIHDPTDSSLLWDAVRVLTRMLEQLRDQTAGVQIKFKDHRRVAKRRAVAIQYGRGAKSRAKQYRDLIRVTENAVRYADNAIAAVDNGLCIYPVKLVEKLTEMIGLTRRVLDQTVRRVINGEQVPADEKLFSLFETHTDIIKKDRRDIFYGHKICVSVGGSNLVTDCFITKGNPADTTLVERMLDRHDQVYGRYPLKVAFDGGFASKDNLAVAKSRGIKDVCFAKKRGIKVPDMCRSEYVYKRLRRFRAGVESAISWLKRCFGLDRCTWKSLPSFHSYVWASVVSANLMTLARCRATT